MFSMLRYCKCGLLAGFIGLLAGMAGQIYIYEFSDRNAALMQAASIFKELDELSFVISFGAATVFLYFCALVQYRRWNKDKQRDKESSHSIR